MSAIRNEPGVHPNVAEAGEQLEALITALVDTAVEPSAITPADRAVLRAMIDLGTWQALRDQGLRPAEAVDAVGQMLPARMADSALGPRNRTARERFRPAGAGG